MPVLSTQGAASAKGLGFGSASGIAPFTGFNQPVVATANYIQIADCCCTANDTFIGIGIDSIGRPTYIKSTDGTTWTTPAQYNGYSTTGFDPKCIAADTTGKVAAFYYLAGVVSVKGIYATYSSDNGTTWTTPVRIKALTNNAGVGTTCCEVSSSGIWVFSGSDSTSAYQLYSTNGTTWSSASSGITGLQAPAHISWNPSLGKFIAFGDNTGIGTNSLAYSSDGSNWTTNQVSMNQYAFTGYAKSNKTGRTLAVASQDVGAGTNSTGFAYTDNGTSVSTGSTNVLQNNYSLGITPTGTFVTVHNSSLSNGAIFSWASSLTGAANSFTTGEYTYYNSGAGNTLYLCKNIACNSAGKLVLLGYGASFYPIVITSK